LNPTHANPPNDPLESENLGRNIQVIRGIEVILDSDLALLYRVETKQFNRSVNRNIHRFPDEFRFQLTDEEFDRLRYQLGTSKKRGGRRYLPYAFTEQGVAMLSAVLQSPTAVQISIQIINAFVALRRFYGVQASLKLRMDLIEKRLIDHEIDTQVSFRRIFDALEQGTLSPTQGIFFDGQVFDAYVFVSDLLRKAESSIVLIDNYVDESVLMQLTKRQPGVSATTLTKEISNSLSLDLKKHNSQYLPISIREFADSHDRFLILDGKTIFHLGASMKDLGKKWFAFSIMDSRGFHMLDKIKHLM